MFSRYRFPLFRVLGIDIKADWTWLILVIMIVWSISLGWAPVMAQGLAPSAYWLIGILAGAGLILSILIHEFCHAIVGRRFGMPMNEITLFLFGGVAHMEDEPPTPKAEFLMAIAGPAASLILSLLFYLLWISTGESLGPIAAVVFAFLAWINLILAAFNLIPAFPLDGGRVLRSILWGIQKDILKATRISSFLGQAFGYFLVGVGIVQFLTGLVINGIWLFVLGLLVIRIAGLSYLQLQVREALKNESIPKLMNPKIKTFSPWQSGDSFTKELISLEGQSVFPVFDGNRLMGCVDLDAVQRLSADQRFRVSLREIMSDCSEDFRIQSDSSAYEAFKKMNKYKLSELLVFDGETLLGRLSLTTLVRYLALKANSNEQAPLGEFVTE